MTGPFEPTNTFSTFDLFTTKCVFALWQRQVKKSTTCSRDGAKFYDYRLWPSAAVVKPQFVSAAVVGPLAPLVDVSKAVT